MYSIRIILDRQPDIIDKHMMGSRILGHILRLPHIEYDSRSRVRSFRHRPVNTEMKILRTYIKPLTHIGMIVTAVELQTVLHLTLHIAGDVKAVGIDTVLVQGKTVPVDLVRIIQRSAAADRYVQRSVCIRDLTFTAIGIDREAVRLPVLKINIDDIRAA